METRYYTEKSNARRAARAAGLDPSAVIETEEGFTFNIPDEIATDPLDIPPILKLTPEERAEGWAKNPPKARPIKLENLNMPKAKPKDRKTKVASGGDKAAILHKMLSGDGATVEELTKALGWLPHTLRARISKLSKPKARGGEGMKIERTRTDGVTSYRIA